MISLFWNYRGVGKRGMATCMLDLIRDHSLDFVGIQETMKKDFSSKFLRKIDLGECFEWKWSSSVGKSRGFYVALRKTLLMLKAVF